MRRIISIYFSPTGNCKKIAVCAGKTLSEKLNYSLEIQDITRVCSRKKLPVLGEDDFIIVTMPVYAGRLPNKIMPILKEMIEGKNTPALALVTYGNRHYDDALSEICLLLTERNFIPVAAAAFPCEHAFSSKLAGGRPTLEDIRLLKDFVIHISENVEQNDSFSPLEVPGNNPPGPYYVPLGKNGMPSKFLQAKPQTQENLCIQCGLCAHNCPMGAISEDYFSFVPGTCIKCQACVRNCPQKAKYFDDTAFLSHVAMLEEFAAERKEIEFYLKGYPIKKEL